jgi:hypothetical protein
MYKCHYIQDCHDTSSTQQEEDSFHQQTELQPKEKIVKRYIWSSAVHGAETWALRRIDQKCLESFEMWYWRRIEKTTRTDRVRNEVSQRIKEERNILQTIKRRNVNWIGHILRRNWLLKHVIKGNVERQEGRWREVEEEGMSRSWITLRKREYIGNWTRKQYITICGELAFSAIMGMLYYRLLNEWWIV